jgi:hypothetical protein
MPHFGFFVPMGWSADYQEEVITMIYQTVDDGYWYIFMNTREQRLLDFVIEV